MLKLSAKFAPIQYFLALIELIWNVAIPFVDLLFPKFILDELSGEKQWNKVLFYIILWVIINGLLLFLKTLKWTISAPIFNGYHVKERIIYGKINSNMDYSRLENGAVLDEKNRIMNNMSLCSFPYDPVTNFITTVIQLIGYVYIISTLNPLIIAFLLVIIFLGSVVSKKRNKIQYDFQSKISKFQRRFNYLFGAMINYNYAKEVRINKASAWLTQKYGEEAIKYTGIIKKNQFKIFQIDIASDLILFVQTLLLYAYSAYRVVIGSITVGSFSMYIGAISSFVGTFTYMVSQLMDLRVKSDYIESYKSYVKASQPTYKKHELYDVNLVDTKHEIEFRDVSFKYPNTDKYVLKNINVTVKSGERLSIVGYNGAGKTTFIKLICRLYEPTEGMILYNGVDISKIKYDRYIKLLSVVFQDYNLYSLSVRDNICLNKNADKAQIIKALSQSDLLEKIQGLDYGIDTQVGREFDKNGIEFSGGEGQKLACARAYLRNAPIIILDEPTAALDPISENKLYERLNNIIGNKTTIYISHRLASAKFCNRIIVFDDGKIVEVGTHLELMNIKGLYYNMFTKQAEYYVENEMEKNCE